MEGSVNVMGRKGGNRLFPTLTLTLTFHHPEQSLLHKLHWLDHVIRVGVFSVLARATLTDTDPHTPLTLTYVNLKAGISMEVCVCWCLCSRAHKQTQTLTHFVV